MVMINPIRYAKSAYRTYTSSKKIMPKEYTEGYFMEKSPLAKGNNVNVAESGLRKLFTKIGKFFFRG